MSKGFSIYLDFVRFLAAVAVVLYHGMEHVGPEVRLVMAGFGHEAVIVFFVLSGYVIASIADQRRSTLREYCVARLARVYSVAVPSILLTCVFDRVGMGVNSEVYEGAAAYSLPLVRVASSLVFMNEVWSISIMLFTNAAYWSLCYEVWYYAAFAAANYSGGRLRWGLLLGMVLLLGPKIPLLAPIWALGLLLARHERLRNLSPKMGLLVFAVSFGAGWAIRAIGLRGKCDAWTTSVLGEEWIAQLTFSRHFVYDYFLALLVFINLMGARSFFGRFDAILCAIATPIRFLAGSTFTLYLLHQPLQRLFSALFKAKLQSHSMYWAIVLCSLVSGVSIGCVIERRKDVAKRLLDKVWDAAGRVLQRV